MRTFKFLFVAAGFFFAASFVNSAHAANPIKESRKQIKRETTVSHTKPFIQVIYLYTTCPNGAVRCVGSIGLTDNGTYIGAYYWGESLACANDQVAIYA